MTANTRATRAGFTLVEILMVIAIIAILVTLLTVGIRRVIGTGSKVRATTDISQIDTVLTKFKEDFKLLPPSQVTVDAASVTPVRPTAGIYRFMVPHQTTQPEFRVFQRMFPRWNPVQPGDPNYNAAPFRVLSDTVTFDLDQLAKNHPDYVALVRLTNRAVNSSAVPLDANQVLVLMLGGPTALLTPTAFAQVDSYGTGWDVAAPYAPTGSASTKKGPYYDFPATRLVADEKTGLTRFTDPWGTPYAYFSAAGDGYDPRASFPWGPGSAAHHAARPTYEGRALENFTKDPNNATTFTAHPYGSNGKWLNPGRCQIISAGPDKLFGPGSFVPTDGTTVLHIWDARNPQGDTTVTYNGQPYPAGSATYYGEGQAHSADNLPATAQAASLVRGADDITNFNEGSALGTTNAR